MTVSAMPYYLDKVREAYFERQRSNPSFSLRAYARYLEIQAPSLSAILRNKRRLSLKAADRVMEKLNLSPVERRRFRDSLIERPGKNETSSTAHAETSSYVLRSEDHYKIIAEWEHFAVLSLLETRDAKSDPAWIAERLGITPLRTRDVIARLIHSGLLKEARGKRLVPTQASIATTEDVSSSALRKSHTDNFKRAQAALEAIAVELRDFSSITVAMDLKKLDEAKALLREFRKQFAALVETPSSDEVYELSIQLFPVTKMEGNRK
jgi:uncharacterized protein (TIGR02147 family)